MAPNTTAVNRATLLDLAQGGDGLIKIQRYRINFDPGEPVEDDADYYGPVSATAAEAAKFDAAVKNWRKAKGEADGLDFYILKYGHRTRKDAVEDARRDLATSPCLVRHADGLYYMHGEDKPGRPTIVDVLIDELQPPR